LGALAVLWAIVFVVSFSVTRRIIALRAANAAVTPDFGVPTRGPTIVDIPLPAGSAAEVRGVAAAPPAPAPAPAAPEAADPSLVRNTAKEALSSMRTVGAAHNKNNKNGANAGGDPLSKLRNFAGEKRTPRALAIRPRAAAAPPPPPPPLTLTEEPAPGDAAIGSLEESCASERASWRACASAASAAGAAIAADLGGVTATTGGGEPGEEGAAAGSPLVTAQSVAVARAIASREWEAEGAREASFCKGARGGSDAAGASANAAAVAGATGASPALAEALRVGRSYFDTEWRMARAAEVEAVPCFWVEVRPTWFAAGAEPVRVCTADPARDKSISAQLHAGFVPRAAHLGPTTSLWVADDAALDLLAASPCTAERPVGIDVGANLGTWTLTLLEAGCAHVLAFEPIFENAARIVKTIDAAGAR
jgi:hypothetical protein